MADPKRAAELHRAESTRLLSAKSVRLLLDCSDRSLRRWMAGGLFPKADLRIGTSLRWRESTVEAWLQERGQQHVR